MSLQAPPYLFTMNVVGFIAVVVLGYAFAWLIQKKVYEEKIVEKHLGLLTFLAETIYFAGLFATILTKNIPLVIINLIILLYTIYGTYGRERIPPKKPEHLADSRWYPGYP